MSTMMELDFEDVESYLKSIEVGCDQQMYQVEMMIGDQVPMLSPQVNSSFSMPVEDLYSPYDTKEFPTSLDDLLKMEELDVFVPINQNNNYSQYNDLEVKTETLFVPVIQVSQYEMSQDNSQYTSSSSDSDEDYVQPNRLSVRKSRKASGSSTASCQDSESEDEWRPEAEDYSPVRKNTRRMRRRSSGGVVKNTQRRRKSKSFSHRPIPQKRSPGTSLKITQWIVSLLRDPMYNPSVITWADETEGVFSIRDTIKLASLWGEVKRNPEMNYEKLSRAMRYSYNNGELEPIREQRLTYKFGPSMTDWEALDRSDPNFEQREQ